jgi:hypothetical protein
LTITDPKAFGEEIRLRTTEIAHFVFTDEFRSMLSELYSKPVSERAEFVRDVMINPEEQDKRGISVPEGMAVQRSTFADGRPTLFCVTNYLSDGKRKVTITFDNPTPEQPISSSPWAQHLVPDLVESAGSTS